MVAMIALFIMVAFPLAVSAAPAITGFSVNRTSIAQSQDVSISITTTAEVNYVFAMVDGVRANGTRTSGNNWTVTVTPSRTTVVTVFANSVNDETGAASVTIPMTVAAAVTPAPIVPAPVAPTPVAPVAPLGAVVTIPPAPANLGPVEIASITETPAPRAGYVQLTVVTGRESNEVWVSYNRPGNQRPGSRWARGTMISQDGTSRTWTIDFRPVTWAVQQVEVGSNRTYSFGGASIQLYNLTLAQPFARAANPSIATASASPSTVVAGGSTTISVRTNLDVENVWIVTADGASYEARRGTTTATQRNWSVTFNPVRSGAVAVYANSAHTEVGAARRNVHINVGTQRASIISASASWQGTHAGNLVINVTTNQWAESVWATLPHTNQRIQLNRTDTGAGSRSWSVNTGNIWHGWGGTDWWWWQNNPDWWWHQHGWYGGNITVHASSLGTFGTDDSRTITAGGWYGGTPTHHVVTSVWPTPGAVTQGVGGRVTLRVHTTSGLHHAWQWHSYGIHTVVDNPAGIIIHPARHIGANVWDVDVDISPTAAAGMRVFTVGTWHHGHVHGGIRTTTVLIVAP